MSEFQVRVVRVGEVKEHPQADRLFVTMIGGEGGYPTIMKKNEDGSPEFPEGSLAVYIPITSLVPAEDPRWDFLRTKASKTGGPPVVTPGPVEIQAMRLRGWYSMGLLTAADPRWVEGQDVAAELGIVRAEPPEPTLGNERDPGLMPVYTDLVALRAFPHALDGQEVVMTEKLHGECYRACWGPNEEGTDRLYVGSRTNWKDPAYDAKECRHWWEIARRLDLASRLKTVPEIGVYGEAFGDHKRMKYGATSDKRGLRLFDAIHRKTRRYLDWDDFLALARQLDLPTVPELYRGPWTPDLRSHANGKSVLHPEHIREGMVARTVKETITPEVGRLVLKLHGEDFTLRKW